MFVQKKRILRSDPIKFVSACEYSRGVIGGERCQLRRAARSFLALNATCQAIIQNMTANQEAKEADTEKRLGLECKKPEQEEERVVVAESARADIKHS